MTRPTDSATGLLRELVSGIEKTLPQAVELRQDLHRNPELGGSEFRTTSALVAAMPWSTPTTVAETGMLVRVGPEAGPSIGLRGELDALPVTEATGIDWAATNGAMHACGHDVHLAALWAFLESAQHLPDLPAAPLGIFQPREECEPSGAHDIVQSKLLRRNDTRAVVGAHVQPQVPLGQISTGAGAVNAAFDEFTITVQGYSGHGAYPQVALDPVPIMASIVLGLHELVSRNVDPTHPTVISVGMVRAGETANVIAADATCRGTLRSTTEEDRHRLHAEIERLAEHTALARGAKARVSIVTGGPALINDRLLAEAVDPLVALAGLRPATVPLRSCGSDDFAYYGLQVPILMMFVGTGDPLRMSDRHQIGLHHASFLPSEETLRHTALSFAAGYVGAAQALGLV